MPKAKAAPKDVRHIVRHADWVEDININPPIAFQPSAPTDGIVVPDIVHVITLLGINMTADDNSIPLTLQLKLWGLRGGVWRELDDLGMMTSNDAAGEFIRHELPFDALGAYERLATGVVGVPTGNNNTLITEFGFMRG